MVKGILLMCLPKAPKPDPAIAKQQAEQRRAELDRLAEEKKKSLVATKRTLRPSGVRSLISGETGGAGFGSNY
jgi:hypothetical protein